MMCMCVVVTYNPDVEFLNRLQKMRHEFKKVIVVDNCSDQLPELELENVLLVRNSSNLGVATAINQGVVTAVAAGATYICLFDQDSIIEPGFSNTLLDGFALNPSVGIVAANYFSPISKKNGYSQSRYHVNYSEIAHAITSGSMISVDVFRECGGTRDDYFIDYVDIEFCERVVAAGFMILCTNSVLMTHPIGEATNHKLFKYRLSASNHSPIRRYYMARNCVYSAVHSVSSNPKFALVSMERLLKITLVTVLFEKAKIRKMQAIALGVYDGLLSQMGRTRRSF